MANTFKVVTFAAEPASAGTPYKMYTTAKDKGFNTLAKELRDTGSKSLQKTDKILRKNKKDGGRMGLKFGSGTKRKSNIEKIKETFGPKQKKVPNKFKGFSKLPEKVQQKIDAKLAKKV